MNFSPQLIELLLPEELPSIAELENNYPPRKLPEGAKVTRLSPSPTGYLHIGGVFMAIINERLAHQSEGVFFLRIEDTDQKREVEKASELIINILNEYGLTPDEGADHHNGSKGAYGPYYQSLRGKIYRAYVKKLLSEGKAYPCFCTNAELDDLRKRQEYDNIRPGYYGKYALWREATEAQIREKLEAKVPFVVRYRSQGNIDKFLTINDLVKGELRLPEDDLDWVILKSDGLPTYHFAHVVDDHLMATTHVIRGEEWLSTLALHIQLFMLMGWRAPKYAHAPLILKMENGSKRKLSKRKDPEASMTYFSEKGYPQRALIEYLLNLANSNFEDWRRANPKEPYEKFQFNLKKLGTTGALFDFVKLNNVSKEFISRMNAEEIYNISMVWAKIYDAKLLEILQKDPVKVKEILNIERTGTKIRKDITTWSDLYAEIIYFFPEHFNLTKDEAKNLLAPMSIDDAKVAAEKFVNVYDIKDDKDAWFEKVKAIATDLGYATNIKDFQANPEKFKGNVSDIAKVYRVLLTGRAQTPDLCSVMRVMGQAECARRLKLLSLQAVS